MSSQYKVSQETEYPHFLSSKEDIHSFTLSHPLPLKMAKQSQIRQNYHEECEALVNRQVNMELYASYVYLSLVRFVGEQQGEDKGEKEGRGAGEVEEERNILEANISGHILHPG